MLTIANDELRVDLLDPTTEADRLGPRFCAGGYIWQVHDQTAGPLLSGPEGPEPQPDPYNGHGLPESFRDRRRDGSPLLWNDDRSEGLAPGVGTLGRRDGEVVIIDPCVWNLALTPTAADFRTTHAAAGFACAVRRVIRLEGRRLISHSELTNPSDHPLHLQWFAHPFFALDAGRMIDLQVPPAATLPPDSGFDLSPTGHLRPGRAFVGKDDGAFALLELPAGQPLDVTLSHHRLRAGIRFSTTFVPSECPIWGNGFTFSVEPYQIITVPPGESVSWDLRYDFSAPNGIA